MNDAWVQIRAFFFFFHTKRWQASWSQIAVLRLFFFLQLDQRSRISCTIVNSVIQKNLYRDNSNCFSLLGVYCVDRSDSDSYPPVLKMEHCALQKFGNQWQLEVKCRPKGSKASSGRWINIKNIYPDATVQVKQNYIELTLPTVEESHEFAVFGTPEVKDKKRMRLGIFGGKATRGQDWNIVGTLLDDTMMAFEVQNKKRFKRLYINREWGLYGKISDLAVLTEWYRSQCGKVEVSDFPVKTERSRLVRSLFLSLFPGIFQARQQ